MVLGSVREGRLNGFTGMNILVGSRNNIGKFTVRKVAKQVTHVLDQYLRQQNGDRALEPCIGVGHGHENYDNFSIL